MRWNAVIALASIAVVLAVTAILTVHFDVSNEESDRVALVSADDLERATFIDPAQWNAFVDLKKEQKAMQSKIKALDKAVEKLAPENTKVIVQVAPPGLPGRQGPRGVKGPVGPRGPPGMRGPPGKQGLRGKTGPTGLVGRPGPRGIAGFPGPRGPTGATGDEGRNGPPGEAGNRGPPGPIGRPGPGGATGPNGLNGPRGNTGLAGMRGPQGVVGVRGVPGPDRRCKWLDVCGICDGDESSCAARRTPDTCHAIGDPHYRTFDGFTFNYQNTGEFILAKHLDDFEVQNKQRVCPNPDVRCNMAVAVRAAGHIIIFYADWGVGSALMDGQQITVQPEVRHDVNDDLYYTIHGTNINLRYKDAGVRVDINPWDNTHYMDIYVDAPARWSNGRSLTGLCWNFDGDINDDNAMLSVAGQFWVGDSDRSLFTHPRPAGMLAVEGGASLMAANHLLHMGPEESEMLAAEPPNQNAEHNVAIAFPSEAARLAAEKFCDDAHGTDKQDCMFDVVAGEPGDGAGDAAAIANLIDHEKLLQVCLYLRSSPAASFAAKRLDPPQNQEGYSFAMWYIPTEGTKGVETGILSKGTQLLVTVPPNTHALSVKMGNAHCVTDSLPENQWSQITMAISETGMMYVWINNVLSCSNNGGAPAAITDDDLLVGDLSNPPAVAVGRIARFFYLPLTVNTDQNKRYAQRQPPGDSCPV